MSEAEIPLKKIAGGAGLVLFGIFFSKVLSYIYRIIIARIGPSEYGLISLALAIYGLVVTVSLLGLNQGVIRYASFYKGIDKYNKVRDVIIFALKTTALTSILFASIMFLLSDWIAENIFYNLALENKITLSLMFKIFAFAVPLDVIATIFLSSIRSFQKIKYEVYSKYLNENLSKLLLTILFLSLGLGIIGVSVAFVLAYGITLILALYFLNNKVFRLFKGSIRSSYINKELLFYSWPLVLGGLLTHLNVWTDTLMLGFFRTASDVGVYNAVTPTVQFIYFFPYALMALFFPVLTELYSQNKKKAFKSIYKTITKWIFMANMLLIFSFILFSTHFIRLFGSEYVRDTTTILGKTFPISSLVLIILSTGYFLAYVLTTSHHVLLIYKRTKLVFLNIFLTVILNVALNYLLIPTYGILGAAIATGTAFIFMAALWFLFSYGVTKINPLKLVYIRILLCIIFSSLIIKLLTHIFPISNFYMWFMYLVMLTVIYGLILLVTKSFAGEDLIILKAIQDKSKIINRMMIRKKFKL